MEGLAAASAVFAVASLAAQVLQGCTYLRDVLQNAIEAPREIRLLLDELSIIEEIVKNAPDTPRHQQALELCNERLSKVCNMVSKFVDVQKPSRCRKWGKQIAMALNAESIQRHLSALREAKRHLENVQNESITTDILETSHQVLSSVGEIHTSTSETAKMMDQTDQKLDAIHDTAKETQRALHELADRFVLMDAKAKVWARQNEQMMRGSIQKGVRDIFEQLLLPALASRDHVKQQLGIGDQIIPSNYLMNWNHLPSCSASTHQKIKEQMEWDTEQRIFELPDDFSLQTACWNQMDLPPYIEKKCPHPTPLDRRFLRFSGRDVRPDAQVDRSKDVF